MTLKYNQRGDTIVEVLIAVAVISSVLGLSYATMNRNMLFLRDNQERTEASKYAQGQVEILKAAWHDPVKKDAIQDRGGGGFCLNLDGTIVHLGHGLPHADASDDNVDDYEDECQNSYYNVGIRRVGGGSSRIYSISVRYDTLGSSARSDVTLVYTLP